MGEFQDEWKISAENELVDGDNAASNVKSIIVDGRPEVAVLIHFLIQIAKTPGARW